MARHALDVTGNHLMRIPRAIVAEIAEQAKREAPNEACGYLFGVDGDVRSVAPLTNLCGSPERFSLDPAEQFAAAREGRAHGLQLMAVYHTHPRSTACMSTEDIRLANDPDLAYAVFSLSEGVLRAFRVNEEKVVTEVKTEITRSCEPAASAYLLDVFRSLRQPLGGEGRSLTLQVQHRQRLESLGVLAGGIAHDFNNLLMVILGNAEAAHLSLTADSPARPRVDEIAKAARKAVDLTSQMLAYSGRGTFQVRRIDLTESVEEMACLLQSSISGNVRLERYLAQGLPAVAADVVQIQQVVMNLIINASEAVGEDAAGVVAVETGVKECTAEYLRQSRLPEKCPAGSYVYLQVRDSGCGMGEPTKEKLFYPFYTTKFTGRGLGLATVWEIVRGHKGAIMVESEEGMGSTFTILFPALSEKRPAAEVERKPSREEGWKGTGTILLAESDEAVRAVVSQMLRKIGFSVLGAEDGQEAVEAFAEHADEISVVLLDLTMPRLSAERALGEIHRIRGNVPVVLSSGFGASELRQRFGQKGVSGFVQKPYCSQSLASAIRSAVEGLGR